MSVNGQFGIPFGFGIGSMAALALSVLAVSAAQQRPQGQYHLHYSPVAQNDGASSGSLATYSPIKSVDGRTLQLRGDDGIVYTFALTADTIYCMGETKVADWTYLKSVPKKASVTVLTSDDASTKAVVVWDKEPAISIQNGHIDFTLPPMCQ